MKLFRWIRPYGLRERVSRYFLNTVTKEEAENVSLSILPGLKFKFNHRDVMHQATILNGYYELDLSKDILKLGKEGGLLVDVGANYGYFSCLWLKCNPNNTSVAIEASPLNSAPLRYNIQQNGFEDRCQIEYFAMGKEQGKMNFQLHTEENQTGWGGLSIEKKTNTDVEVEVRTLDDYFKTPVQIKVLKVDVEGADTWVIEGAKKLLMEKRIEHIYFEANKLRMSKLEIDPNEIFEFLSGVGYETIRMDEELFHSFPKLK